jgi:hypothetical protein
MKTIMTKQKPETPYIVTYRAAYQMPEDISGFFMVERR